MNESALASATLDVRCQQWFADVILQVNAEVISHGAEISLLRDLYLARHRRT